eukprot:scaffold20022_cov112-Isochrysis_galbana.AAC.4
MEIYRIRITTNGPAAQLPTISAQNNTTGASNVLNTSNVTNSGGTNWTPNTLFAESVINGSSYSYFEIDLGEMIGITKVVVQGRYGYNRFASFSILNANRTTLYTRLNTLMMWMDPAFPAARARGPCLPASSPGQAPQLVGALGADLELRGEHQDDGEGCVEGAGNGQPWKTIVYMYEYIHICM